MIIMLFFITTPVYVGQKNLFGSAYASSNATSRTDPVLVFFLTNPTGNFNATRSISSLIVQRSNSRSAICPCRRLNVLALNGIISKFKASFTMVSVNGQ